MNNPPAVKIHTFGCQMNRLDSEIAAESLAAAGYRLVEDENEADVVLFNTCSVRDHAEERVLQRIRQHWRPGVKLGILGCLAQRMGPELFTHLKNRLQIVCGTRRFPLIDDLVSRALSGEEQVIDVGEEELPFPGMGAPHARGRHKGMQGYVTVMRGCNNFCSYCIVPYVRGRELSRPVEAVVEEAAALARAGAVEVTLLGQNIDAYGKDNGSSLAALLRAVHNGIPQLQRIRYVTSHPRDITRELLQTVAELPRVCRHLHMPAQSGSDRVLQTMRRGYTRAIYEEKLAAVRELVPGMLVTSDFIVGFPGETDEDFRQTAELVAAAGFQTSYVFKYSPRPGTLAAQTLPDNIPDAVKSARNRELLAIQEEVSRRRNTGLIGQEVEVLVEGVSPRNPERLTGRTSNNLICVFPRPDAISASAGMPAAARPDADEGATAHPLSGKLARLRIVDATPLTLYGEQNEG